MLYKIIILIILFYTINKNKILNQIMINKSQNFKYRQVNRNNRINRFREPNQQNIIESDYKEEKKDEE